MDDLDKILRDLGVSSANELVSNYKSLEMKLGNSIPKIGRYASKTEIADFINRAFPKELLAEETDFPMLKLQEEIIDGVVSDKTKKSLAKGMKDFKLDVLKKLDYEVPETEEELAKVDFEGLFKSEMEEMTKARVEALDSEGESEEEVSSVEEFDGDSGVKESEGKKIRAYKSSKGKSVDATLDRVSDKDFADILTDPMSSKASELKDAIGKAGEIDDSYEDSGLVS